MSDAVVAFGPFGLSVFLKACIAESACAHDSPRTQCACFAGVRYELAEGVSHVRACIAHADLAPVPCHLHREVYLAVIPRVAQFIEGHGHRAEGCSGVAVHRVHDVAQSDGVRQHDQTHLFQGGVSGSARRHIACDDGDFSREVDA